MHVKRPWFVYVDRAADTGAPFYVGKGNLARCKRAERNKHHTNVSTKHGSRREVVLATLNESYALAEEIRLIAELHTCVFDPCYNGIGTNYTFGGDGVSGYKHVAESNAKNAEAHTGLVQSVAACDRKRQSMLASSAVHRKRVVQRSRSGIVVAVHPSVSAAARAVGRPSAATLVSRCCRGKATAFAGFKWEYVEPQSATLKGEAPRPNDCRPVEQLELSSDRVVGCHPSIADAGRALNRNSGSIGLCCRGHRKTAYGFRWRYVTVGR